MSELGEVEPCAVDSECEIYFNPQQAEEFKNQHRKESAKPGYKL